MTKLYFHASSSGVGGTLPSTTQSTAYTPVKNVDAQTVNRSMSESAGAAQTSLALTSNATTSAQTYYFTRFVSPQIYQTSISAQTWTYAFAAMESNANANFPVTTNNKVSPVCCYVWRPSNGTRIGYILDGSSAATLDEVSTSEAGRVVQFTGAAVNNVQNDDVICFEVIFTTTQGSATAYTDTWYYDGTTDPTDGSATSNAASYLSTPETLNLTAPNNVVKNMPTETTTVNEPNPPAPVRIHNFIASISTQFISISEQAYDRLVTKQRAPPTQNITINEQSFDRLATKQRPLSTETTTIVEQSFTRLIEKLRNPPAQNTTIGESVTQQKQSGGPHNIEKTLNESAITIIEAAFYRMCAKWRKIGFSL